MIRPNDIKTTTDYHLFKHGVSPTWEDPVNKNGGKWMVRLKKGLSSRLWEELVLAIIGKDSPHLVEPIRILKLYFLFVGEQFDVGHEICGAVISVRHSEDIISVWNKTADNNEATTKIRSLKHIFYHYLSYLILFLDVEIKCVAFSRSLPLYRLNIRSTRIV